MHAIVRQDLEGIVDLNLNWELLRGSTVLVTGATGFIASHLALTILIANERFSLDLRVIALARTKSKFQKKYGDLYSNALTFLEGDVEGVACANAAASANFIIHAASPASPKHYGVDPIGTLSANVIGTNNILQHVNPERLKCFLYISSAEVYGVPTKIPAAENDYGYLDPLLVRSCYAESKRMAETMCASWLKQRNVPCKIVRPFHTYGPGLDLDDGRVYADFIRAAVLSHSIEILSDGSAKRAYCYISDAVSAILHVIFYGEVGAAYNIGNDTAEASVLELADVLLGLYPHRIRQVKRLGKRAKGSYLPSPVDRIIPDLSLIKQLGWSPVVNLRAGMARTVESYLDGY